MHDGTKLPDNVAELSKEKITTLLLMAIEEDIK